MPPASPGIPPGHPICSSKPYNAVSIPGLQKSRAVRRLLIAGILAIVPFQLHAQGRGQAPLTARTAAPFDITGYWVALVTDDWRYRMLTPPKGNVDYLPVNAEGRRATNSWDPAKDEASGQQCRAYGAGGVMRLPGRLHITWESDNTLRLETDTGSQTRRFLFGDPPASTDAPTWQGRSIARWEFPPVARGRGPGSDI